MAKGGGHRSKHSQIKIGLEVPCDRCCKLREVKLKSGQTKEPVPQVQHIEVKKLSTESEVRAAEKPEEHAIA